MPMVTRTGQDIPGDPINVGLVGDSPTWSARCTRPAGIRPIDHAEILDRIVGSVLLDRQYRDAPVSNLYYLGRREDLAYEKPIGASADRRNHVRYWKVLERAKNSARSGSARRPGIAASASANTPQRSRTKTPRFTPSAPCSRPTGKRRHGGSKYQVTGIGPTIAGHNGGGDLDYTDGEIWVLRLVEGCKKRDGPAVTIRAPRRRR